LKQDILNHNGIYNITVFYLLWFWWLCIYYLIIWFFDMHLLFYYFLVIISILKISVLKHALKISTICKKLKWKWQLFKCIDLIVLGFLSYCCMILWNRPNIFLLLMWKQLEYFRKRDRKYLFVSIFFEGLII